MKKRRIMVPIILLALACPVIPGFDSGLKVRCYTVESDAVQAPVRVALISDLHSCGYGENQRELIDAVDSQNPDLVLMTGDIFDDELPDDNTEQFLRGVKLKKFRTVGKQNRIIPIFRSFSHLINLLEKAYRVPCWIRRSGKRGLRVVNPAKIDRRATNRNRFTDAGKPMDPTLLKDIHFFQKSAAAAPVFMVPGHIVAWIPFPNAAQGFDLALCGHAHGGQFRIPGILNGLYAPNQGFFPKYAGGEYHKKRTVMIVSRGLARESTRVPRFYNRPELVIIDIV